VPSKSAVIGHLRETAKGINGDHSQVCKFGDKSSPGYIAVVGALEDYIDLAKKRSTAAVVAGPESVPDVSVINSSEPVGSGATHHGNIESGGVGIYGSSSFSGPTTIGMDL